MKKINEVKLYRNTCIVLLVSIILLSCSSIIQYFKILTKEKCPALPTCSEKGITSYCGESCSNICNLDCPLPSSYCNEIDDICPEEMQTMCSLILECPKCVPTSAVESLYYCNEPSKYACDSVHRVGNTSLSSINIKCSDGRVKVWDCKIDNWRE